MQKLYGQTTPTSDPILIAESAFFKVVSTYVYDANNNLILTLDPERGHWNTGKPGEYFICFGQMDSLKISSRSGCFLR